MSYNPITHPPGAKNPSDDLISCMIAAAAAAAEG
jgi:hypothetical protein